jgi:hypothetical protein
LIKCDIKPLKKLIVEKEDKNYKKYNDLLTSLYNMALDEVPELV